MWASLRPSRNPEAMRDEMGRLQPQSDAGPVPAGGGVRRGPRLFREGGGAGLRHGLARRAPVLDLRRRHLDAGLCRGGGPAHQAHQDRHGGGGNPLQPPAQDRVGFRADRHTEPRAPPVRRRAGLPAARICRPRRADGGSARDDERRRRHRARRLDERDGQPPGRPPLAHSRPRRMPAETGPAAASAGLSGDDLAGELHPGGGEGLPPAAGLALHLPHLPGGLGGEAAGEPRRL